MRKAQKEDLLQIIDSLQQAHEEIISMIEQQQLPIVLSMLAECQEYAINLGGIVEQSEGENCKTISCLEEYCEMLFRIHESISNQTQDIVISKCLNEMIHKLRDSIGKDIIAQKEVVFFPYKASMWDSLESVYLAAKEDPSCDAYCVPIPYYDKNPDGSFGDMHYEGNQYPENIEVINWEQYDFENRKPDEIYIHNPYDSWNYVTSVHPRFYAENLRRYTNNLIYIPYFVLPEIEPEDKDKIEGMKHFCFLPGTVYADTVIVQSENIRQIYINEFMKAAKEEGLTGDYTNPDKVKEKIINRGSPKFDKVLHTNKSDISIPEKWLSKIRKEDGSWKKVIFYNTSVSALLMHGEKMLSKIQDVLQIFSEHQKDITLLWRPHPLIESTMKAMRPRLLVQYQEIVRKYREENWGIYDETPDVERAIALSDAYYGDTSSVVELYEKTNKKIMIQNVEAIHSNLTFAVTEPVLCNNEYWCFGMSDSIIYKWNPSTYIFTSVRCVSDENSILDVKLLYGKVIPYEKKLFFIPWLAENILVYDTELNTIRYIPLAIRRIGGGNLFEDGICRGEMLYLIPSAADRILGLNMSNETIIKESKSIIPLLNKNQERHCLAFGSIAQSGDSVLFTSVTSDQMFTYNMNTNEIICESNALLENGGNGICGDDDGFWVVPRDAHTIQYQYKYSGEIIEFNDFPTDFKETKWAFSKLFCFQGDLILLPREADYALRVSRYQSKIMKLEMRDDLQEKKNYWDKYFRYTSAHDYSEYLYIFERTGCLFILDKTGEIREENVTINNLEELVYREMLYEKDNFYQSLENFLKICLKEGTE